MGEKKEPVAGSFEAGSTGLGRRLKRFQEGFAEAARRSGELAGNRTQDPRLKRALLYQLSYELK
jgi:hypothetical protein